MQTYLLVGEISASIFFGVLLKHFIVIHYNAFSYCALVQYTNFIMNLKERKFFSGKVRASISYPFGKNVGFFFCGRKVFTDKSFYYIQGLSDTEV